jgi:uncharacterized membrane protein
MSEYHENNPISFEESEQELYDKLTFGEKFADSVAKLGGSWSFIFGFISLLVLWILINSLQYFKLIQWDAYPYILLNLILSCIAALQAPIIMMSQNRQNDTDRKYAEQDRNVNKQSEIEIQNLKRQLINIQKTLDEDRRIQQEQTKILNDLQNKLRK